MFVNFTLSRFTLLSRISAAFKFQIVFSAAAPSMGDCLVKILCYFCTGRMLEQATQIAKTFHHSLNKYLHKPNGFARREAPKESGREPEFITEPTICECAKKLIENVIVLMANKHRGTATVEERG